jgi:hypothetical protein
MNIAYRDTRQFFISKKKRGFQKHNISIIARILGVILYLDLEG